MQKLNGKFLDAQTFDGIPVGLKENVYFTIDNSTNIERRSRGQRSVFADDCGVWDGKSSSTKNAKFIHRTNGKVEFVVIL
jgi:hypothetical protein